VKDITTIINNLECKKKWRRWRWSCIMKGRHPSSIRLWCLHLGLCSLHILRLLLD
jgi:hypothetical protein